MDFSTLNFVACLALHQNRRDKALGLNHITTKARGLIWYYNVKQRELLTSIAKASFKLGTIQQIDKRMSQIMAEAGSAPIERKRELLKEAVQLQKQAKKLRKIG